MVPEPLALEPPQKPALDQPKSARELLTLDALPSDQPGNAWWNAGVAAPLRAETRPWVVDLDTLLLVALSKSDHILAVSLEPLIRETEIDRQLAQFDSAAFLESKWNDLNDPAGNTLTTGGPSRYLDNAWQNRGGVRRKNWLGGQAEFAQEMGLRDTNSVYFVPANQANTRLVLSYTQPLLRGSGQCYNESVIVLARTDVQLARHELEGQLQDHLLAVSEGYWKLWLERARLMQRRDAAAKTAALLRELENRRDLDVLQSHLLRAKGALAVHLAAAQRAEYAVRNQETRLWALTGATELHSKNATELVPQNLPSMDLPTPDRDGSVQRAVQQRPEVTATLQRIRAAQTRTDVAVHDHRRSTHGPEGFHPTRNKRLKRSPIRVHVIARGVCGAAGLLGNMLEDEARNEVVFRVNECPRHRFEMRGLPPGFGMETVENLLNAGSGPGSLFWCRLRHFDACLTKRHG
jgi:hypothetical protein